jgi:formate dehydrogenase subunit gamma
MPLAAPLGNLTRATRVHDIASERRHLRGALLPILHAVQDELGHVDTADIDLIADVLNMSVAEVHGVVSFYKDFRRSPAGRHVVRICRAEACQAAGTADLVAHAKRRLGVEVGETTPDGSVTLEEVFCFGNCALGPAVEVDGRLRGRISADSFDAVLGEVAR